MFFVLHGLALFVGLLRFALAAEAELVDFALDLVGDEVDAGEGEGALEAELVDDGGWAGRQIEFGVELELAGHDGRLIFDGEQEHVVDVAGVDGDVEADVAALNAGNADDLALGNDVAVQEPGIDGLEPGVAIGAVNDGMKRGVEGYGAVGDVEGEVGGGGFAVDDDVIELALVFAVGGEHTADAFDGVEVGVAEGVGAIDGGIAGAFGIEGAEVAGGVDVADGFGIDERGVKGHGTAGADGLEDELVDDELEGDLAGLAVFDDEVGVVDVDDADEDIDFAVAFIDAGF